MHDQSQASNIVERYNHLCSLRSPWVSMWNDLATYLMPRKYGATLVTSSPNSGREARLFDTTAIHANAVLANGQLAWITPQGSNWFSLTPPAKFKRSEPVKAWLQECTEIIRDLLSNSSNFYSAIHEFYLDRSCFGTAAMHVEPGKKFAFNFIVVPMGSFVIDEDDEGNVDTIFREIELTARAAEMKFGRDALPQKIIDCLDSTEGSKKDTKFKFIHAVLPRDPSKVNPDKGALGMPFAQFYIELTEKRVVLESGYPEIRTMVSRYLEWSNGLGGLYGWSPAWAALPEAKQLNLLQMWMDAMAEKMAFPPILKPASMDGEIDLSAGAINEYDDSQPNAALPKELVTSGNYDAGLQRIQERQQSIRRHFHVDLFEMFSQQSKTMTATEVNARIREKVVQISPSFARLTTELLNPLLQAVFSICLERGYIPMPPPEMVEPVSETMADVSPPRVEYQNRMDIELRNMGDAAFERYLQQLAGISQFDQSVVDNVNFDKPARALAAGNGLPAEYLRPVEERDQIREQRMQQQQAAQEAAMLEQAGKTAASVSKVDSENVQKLIEAAS